MTSIASMGPRSFGRGIHFVARRHSLTNQASMRPRSFGRGIPVLVKAGTGLFSASMGPRSFGRGITIEADLGLSPTLCFNGAALIRARNREACERFADK